jgi:molecular chaperone HscA
MLRAGFEHANTDMKLRALREHSVEAERLIEATRQALGEDAHLLDADERTRIEAAISVLTGLLSGTDADAVKSAVDALSAVTGEFAARRMDQAIRKALTGNRVDNLSV